MDSCQIVQLGPPFGQLDPLPPGKAGHGLNHLRCLGAGELFGTAFAGVYTSMSMLYCGVQQCVFSGLAVATAPAAGKTAPNWTRLDN